jgi:hypothetical protein
MKLNFQPPKPAALPEYTTPAFGPGLRTGPPTQRSNQVNPWEAYTKALRTGNYPGSSGTWADAPSTGTSQWGYRPGLGLPGERFKNQLAASFNVDPKREDGNANLMTTGTGTSGMTAGGKPNDVRDLYESIEIPKDAAMVDAYQKLMAQFGKQSESNDALRRELGPSIEQLKAAFQKENEALDISGYAKGQRDLDDRLASGVGDYEARARDIIGRYTQSDADYAKQLEDITQRAYGILPEYDRAASAIGDYQIGQQEKQLSKYKIGGGNLGIGSGDLQSIARGVADVRLPLEQARIQRQYDVLTGVELPSQREVATRSASRMAGFEYPVERDIFAQGQGANERRKLTEAQIKQLEMAAAASGRESAMQYPQLIQQLIARDNANLGGQIANLSGAGSIGDQAYYRGLHYTPGADLSQPQYVSNAMPGYPGYNPGPGASAGGGGFVGGGGGVGGQPGTPTSGYVPGGGGAMSPFEQSLSPGARNALASMGSKPLPKMVYGGPDPSRPPSGQPAIPQLDYMPAGWLWQNPEFQYA